MQPPQATAMQPLPWHSTPRVGHGMSAAKLAMMLGADTTMEVVTALNLLCGPA